MLSLTWDKINKSFFYIVSILAMCLYFWKKSITLGANEQKAKDAEAENDIQKDIISAQQKALEAEANSPDTSDIVSSLEEGKAVE